MDASMHLGFHFGTNETLFFEQWLGYPEGHFLVTCVVVFAFAFIYEGFRVLVDYVKICKNAAYSTRAASSTGLKDASNYGATETTAVFDDGEFDKRSCGGDVCCFHILHAILSVLQSFLGYSLMVIFMSLNFWLCALLCLGIGFGVLVFRIPSCLTQAPPKEETGSKKD